MHRVSMNLGLACLAVALFCATGCATPKSRIRDNPSVFAEFGQDVQAKVRQGEIDLGFSREAVHIALGEPDRRYVRTTTGGRSEVWSYVAREMHHDRQRVQATFRVRDSDGHTRRVRDSVWVDVRNSREYEKVRVEMRDGTVVAIENINR